MTMNFILTRFVPFIIGTYTPDKHFIEHILAQILLVKMNVNNNLKSDNC